MGESTCCNIKRLFTIFNKDTDHFVASFAKRSGSNIFLVDIITHHIAPYIFLWLHYHQPHLNWSSTVSALQHFYRLVHICNYRHKEFASMLTSCHLNCNIGNLYLSLQSSIKVAGIYRIILYKL